MEEELIFIGKMGVDGVINGKLPNGDPYTWTKRRKRSKHPQLLWKVDMQQKYEVLTERVWNKMSAMGIYPSFMLYSDLTNPELTCKMLSELLVKLENM